ncbi:importin subunit alpha-1 [Ditylenchus destructor]|nr:importin subunit alpha-1 [Ditylenchus destructor]
MKEQVMNLLTNKGFSSHEASIFLGMLDAQSSMEAQIASSLFFRKKLAACQEPPTELITAILNASWAITNLACGSRQDTHRIVNLGGVIALKRLAENSSGEIRDQVLWALGNLAADCEKCRNCVRASGMLAILIHCLESTHYIQIQSRKIAIWCLVNILRTGMSNIPMNDVVRLLRVLHYTISNYQTEEIISDGIWCVAYLMDNGNVEIERINALFEQDGLADEIVEYLKNSSPRILAGALRSIGNVITGTDEQTTRMLNNGQVLNDLKNLMDSDQPQISRECIWILSNIAAGTEDHVSSLFAVNGMIEGIFRLCKDSSAKKRKEAFWVIVNALTGASEDVYEHLLSGGVGHVLVQIIDEYADAALIERTLHTIHSSLFSRPDSRQYTVAIFQRVGLVKCLYKIATADESTLLNINSEIAKNILRNFFDIIPEPGKELVQTSGVPSLTEPIIVKVKRAER